MVILSIIGELKGTLLQVIKDAPMWLRRKEETMARCLGLLYCCSHAGQLLYIANSLGIL